jgi:hypothetical protein
MISFFTMLHGEPHRVRSGAIHIRAHQICEYLGGRMNPRNGFEDDVCVFVKSIPFENYPKRSYMDIVDAVERTNWVSKHDIGIIAISKIAKRYLEEYTGRKAILIPQHHCNFKREQRKRTGVTVVGACGSENIITLPIDELRKRLREIDVELILDYNTKDRETSVHFYKQIDVQVLFRANIIKRHRYSLKSPLKLTNAGSFCIPTVSFPEPNYIDEYSGYFIPVMSMDEMVNEVKKLKEDQMYYDYWSHVGIDKAEEYHIEHIAELYKQL